MEIVLLIVGLVFFALGAFLISQDKKPRHARKKHAKIIGYIKKSSIYTPVFEYKNFNGQMKYGKWPIGSSYFTHSVGEKIEILENPKFPDQVWPQKSGLRFVSKIFVVIGIALCALFFKIYRFNTFNLIFSAGVLASIIFKVTTGKFSKNLDEDKLKEVMKKAKGKAFSVAVYSSLEDGEIKLREQEKLLRDWSTMRKHQGSDKKFALGFGLIIVLASSFWLVKRHEFLKTALKAPAKIVGFKSKRSSNSTTYAAKFKFKPQGSIKSIVVVDSYSSSHPSLKSGQSVNLLYDQYNHKSVLVDEGEILNYQALGIVFIAEFVFFVLGLTMKTKKIRLTASRTKSRISSKEAA